MRHSLLAIALAASFAFAATGHAGAPSGEGYYGHYQQNCITKRIRTTDRHGKSVVKRVRICR